jgi:hypothetical protein
LFLCQNHIRTQRQVSVVFLDIVLQSEVGLDGQEIPDPIHVLAEGNQPIFVSIDLLKELPEESITDPVDV